MRPIHSQRVEVWADTVYSSIGCPSPPIDLYALARRRRVKSIKLRLMIPRGAVVPVDGGFEVFIRNLEPKDTDIENPEPDGLFNAQQRFTLAHEIAHTHFFQGLEGTPIPSTEVKLHSDLEEICDRAAKRILVPRDLLRKEIRLSNGGSQHIDIGFVRSMASRFRASYEVILERLRAAEPDGPTSRCLLLARRRDGETRVMTWFLGSSLLSALPPLHKYQAIKTWLPVLPDHLLERDRPMNLDLKIGKRQLHVRKEPIGLANDFFLQLDEIAGLS